MNYNGPPFNYITNYEYNKMQYNLQNHTEFLHSVNLYLYNQLVYKLCLCNIFQKVILSTKRNNKSMCSK